jgi:acetyl-CoA carboxylase biotin carboxyl carrier protein
MTMNNNSGGSGFAIHELREMAQIIKENELTKLAITQGEFMILMERKPETVQTGFAPSDGAPVLKPYREEAGANPAAGKYDGEVVRAPVVGTFYAAPSPGAAPYVTLGQWVNKGDVLMIIESMKLMNEIQSEFDGTVTEILVKDGESVEFDQPIMVIKNI